MMRFLMLSFLIFLSTGCQRQYLSVIKLDINKDRLASTYVKSPDPRQKNPPKGEELVIEWTLPSSVMKKKPFLRLSLIYNDYSQEHLTRKILRRSGSVNYSVLGKKFKEKQGLLTYKVDVVSSDNKILKEWRQALWTPLITLDQEDI